MGDVTALDGPLPIRGQGVLRLSGKAQLQWLFNGQFGLKNLSRLCGSFATNPPDLDAAFS